jgi:SAM-dependent methyltransferase
MDLVSTGGLDDIARYLTGGDLLVDLGCGNGRWLDVFAPRYRSAVGLDRSNRRLVGDTRRFTSRPGDRPKSWIMVCANLDGIIPLVDSCVDTVFSNQVIEHVVDPVAFAREVARILKPSGHAILTTPNSRYLRYLWMLAVHGKLRTGGSDDTDGVWDNGHLHYFTHSDIRALLQQAGFVEVSSRALIGRRSSQKFIWLRQLMRGLAGAFPVREFLSGNMLVIARRGQRP